MGRRWRTEAILADRGEGQRASAVDPSKSRARIPCFQSLAGGFPGDRNTRAGIGAEAIPANRGEDKRASAVDAAKSRARIQCFQDLAADFPGDRNARAGVGAEAIAADRGERQRASAIDPSKSRARIQCFQELAPGFPGDRNARGAYGSGNCQTPRRHRELVKGVERRPSFDRLWRRGDPGERRTLWFPCIAFPCDRRLVLRAPRDRRTSGARLGRLRHFCNGQARRNIVPIKPGDREAVVGILRFRPHDRSIAPNLSIVHDLFWIAPKPGQRIRRRSTSRLRRQRPDDPGSAPPRPWSTSRSVPPHPSPQSPSRPGAEQAPARNGDEAGRRRPAREPCMTASGNGEFGFDSYASWYSGYPAVLPNEM